LSRACAFNHVKVAELLLKNGAQMEPGQAATATSTSTLGGQGQDQPAAEPSSSEAIASGTGKVGFASDTDTDDRSGGGALGGGGGGSGDEAEAAERSRQRDCVSPLIRAAENGQWECVRLLLHYGADVNCTDKAGHGHTPLDRALGRSVSTPRGSGNNSHGR
jgi:hypothetical protein